MIPERIQLQRYFDSFAITPLCFHSVEHIIDSLCPLHLPRRAVSSLNPANTVFLRPLSEMQRSCSVLPTGSKKGSL